MPFINDMWNIRTAGELEGNPAAAGIIRGEHESFNEALEQAELTAQQMRGKFNNDLQAVSEMAKTTGELDRVRDSADSSRDAQLHHMRQLLEGINRTTTASVKTAAGTGDAVQHVLRTIGTAILNHTNVTDHITDTHWGHSKQAFNVLSKYHNAYAMGNTAENVVNYFRNKPKNELDEETAARHSKLAEQHARITRDIDDILRMRAMGTPDHKLEAETAYDGTLAALRSAGMLGIKVPTPFTNYFNHKRDNIVRNHAPRTQQEETCEHGVPLTAVMNDAACPQCFNEANAHDDDTPYEISDVDFM